MGEIEGPAACGAHDHLCWPYRTDEGWRRAAVEHLAQGARDGDVLLFVGAGEADALADALEDLPGRDAMLSAGTLHIAAADRIAPPLDDAAYSPEAVIAGIEGLLAQVRAGGHHGLRSAADVSHLVPTTAHGRRYAGVELRVDAVIAGAPWSALCGYDLRRVPGAALDATRFVHPLTAPSGDPGDDRAALVADDAGGWRLAGAVSLAQRETLAHALDALPRDEDVHIDLGDLDAIDVGGVRALVEVARGMPSGRRLVLHEAPRMLRRILDLGWGDVPALVLG